MKFFKQVGAEMAKVVWPSRQNTIMFTIIVIVVSLAVAYYLNLFDFLFQNYGLKTLIG
jgi:preprotein translocase subunit SecE